MPDQISQFKEKSAKRSADRANECSRLSLGVSGTPLRIVHHVIIYQGKELFDDIIGRHTTYAIYGAVVIGSLLLSSEANVRIFGLLVTVVLAVTYLFFAYAYISVFCFGGAIMSLYLVWTIFGGGWRWASAGHAAR